MNIKTYWAVVERENGDVLESAFEAPADAMDYIVDLCDEDEEKGVYDGNAYTIVSYHFEEARRED